MKKNTWYKNPEMIIGLSALTVSLVAVFVGVYSAYIDRAYARAAVWPRLELFRSYYSDNQTKTFKYGVTNSGTGPALIKYVKIRYGLKSIRNWNELFNEVGIEIINFNQTQIGYRTIPSQNVVEPLIINHDENRKDIAKFVSIEESLVEIEICYCSIYNECWVVNRNDLPVELAGLCEIHSDENFHQ